LSKRFYEIQKAILKLEDDFSYEAIKEILEGKVKPQVKDLTFNAFANQVINEFLEVKRTGNAIVYRTSVKRFTDFCNNSS